MRVNLWRVHKDDNDDVHVRNLGDYPSVADALAYAAEGGGPGTFRVTGTGGAVLARVTLFSALSAAAYGRRVGTTQHRAPPPKG